jgi:hypothetical protein
VDKTETLLVLRLSSAEKLTRAIIFVLKINLKFNFCGGIHKTSYEVPTINISVGVPCRFSEVIFQVKSVTLRYPLAVRRFGEYLPRLGDDAKACALVKKSIFVFRFYSGWGERAIVK